MAPSPTTLPSDSTGQCCFLCSDALDGPARDAIGSADGVRQVVESSLRFIDAADLPQYVQQWNGRAVDAEATAALLAEGKVIGVLRGRYL